MSEPGRLLVPGLMKVYGRAGRWWNPIMLVYVPVFVLLVIATMIDHERETYFTWLASAGPVEAAIRRLFEPVIPRRKCGKLFLLAMN